MPALTMGGGFGRRLASIAGAPPRCTLFEIRLENDFIVFRGSEDESAGQTVRGAVLLSLSGSLRVEDVRVRLEGTLRHKWVDSTPTPSGSGLRVDVKQTLLNTVQSVMPQGPLTLTPGNYSWPFEFYLDGNTAESVEGLAEASITYRIRVTIDRGKLAHDMHATRHLRVIRTLQYNALELMHAMSVENTWPGKIDYSIVLARKSVLFGANAVIDMCLTPLLKGLTIGAIQARMVEYRDCSVPGATSMTTRSRKSQTDVATWSWTDDPGQYWQDVIGTTGQEGWVMRKIMPLPRNLGQCLQDLCHHGIKIRHKIKVTIALHNPDGHVSELRATLPISIYISPNTPIDDHGNLAEVAGRRSSDTMAPPAYDLRHLDLLYEGIDPSGFMTPQPSSGAGTPFYALSRVASSENLALNSMLANNAVHPAELHRVLGGLPGSHSDSSSLASPFSTAQTPRSTPASTPGTSSPSRRQATPAACLPAISGDRFHVLEPLGPCQCLPEQALSGPPSLEDLTISGASGEAQQSESLRSEDHESGTQPGTRLRSQEPESTLDSTIQGTQNGATSLTLSKLPSYRTAISAPPAYSDSPAESARPRLLRTQRSGGHGHGHGHGHGPLAAVMHFLHRHDEHGQHV